ncbi:hypothetical protein CYMTET_10619 [Cymbomonas tetramitiformis]|uniref:Uncharacterized protein n=1 Tax=Cymbomonas tetramitiformis TaxID=36881 RepID=A0AAE0GP80_9CHLO|nr:hypothetical protein CYMTET_10619 [Cymbomonas tetramitiformis]
MPTLEDFSKPDFIFNQKGHDSRFNLCRDVSIRLLLHRTCHVAYKVVHEKCTDEEIARKPELTLVSCGLAIQRAYYNNSDNPKVLNTCAARAEKAKAKEARMVKAKGRRENAASPSTQGPSSSKEIVGPAVGDTARWTVYTHNTRRLTPCNLTLPPALAKGAFTGVLAARYQAAYEHSEEAFQYVCWEHGAPDICDPTESVCTYPDDGSLYFSAYLTQEDEAAHSPAWGRPPHDYADFEWDAWGSDPYTQEQHEEWERLQQKAVASFQAFCQEWGSEEDEDTLSLGRVHVGNFGVGGVDRGTTPPPPTADHGQSTDSSRRPLVVSAFYTPAPSMMCTPCDSHTAHVLSQTDTGVVLGEFAQRTLQTDTGPVDTPDGDSHEGTCMHPALYTHDTPLEHSSGLFGELVLTVGAWDWVVGARPLPAPSHRRGAIPLGQSVG